MDIYTQGSPAGAINSLSFKPPAAMRDAAGAKGAFGQAFDAALAVWNETNDCQKTAEALQLDLAAGRTDDMLSVLLAQEKAYSSLNFTVQVTNRLIEGYREIMRMQL